MTNKLTKDKTLTDYVPAVTARAGVPGSPAIPARVTRELVPMRIEVPASAMEVLYRSFNPRTNGYEFSTSRPPGRDVSVVIQSPLEKLRASLNRPGLTAEQAHYTETLAVADIAGGQYIVPMQWSVAWVEELRWVTTIIPAVPAVPAIPAVKGSPAVFTYNKHLGWNAGARSEKVMDPDTSYVLKFTTGNNIGAVVGLARAADVQGLSRRSGFGHIITGVAIGDGVIRLIRNGVFARDAIGQIIEVGSVTGEESFSLRLSSGGCQWTHGMAGEFARERVPSGVPYVLDAVMYAGDDYVDSPSIAESPVLNGEMEFNLQMRAIQINAVAGEPSVARIIMAAPRLRASDSTSWADITADMVPLGVVVTMTGTAGGNLSMQAMRGALGTVAQGFADLRAPRMTLESEGGETWVPTYSIAEPVLHPLTMSAVLLVGGLIEANLEMAAPWMRASENIYGEAALGLEAMTLIGGLLTGRGRVDMTERILPFNSITENLYITVVLTERVRGKDSAAPQLLAVASMLEMLDAQDAASVTQRALAFLLEQIGALGLHRALTFRVDGDGWTLVDDSEGWAVNTETGGSSRYAGFGYDSFATVKGRHLGVRADGVYLLEGDTDAGRPIHAGVHLGLQDFGTSQLKHLSNVYLGVSATGGLFIKVGVGEGAEKLEYTYAARRVDAHLATQRFDLGRGLRSNYFSFELINDGEADFELEKIEFVAIASNRRI